MAGLLVSVRDAHEATEAWLGGADIIDVKEPAHGALGAATPTTWQEIQDCLQLLQGQATPGLRPPVMWSAACGELLAEVPATDRIPPYGYSFAKLGLAGCHSTRDWPQAWRQWAQSLARGTHPVAVIYADVIRAHAPDPHEIVAVTANAGCRIVLVDTFDKSTGDLLSVVAPDVLGTWLGHARKQGQRVVLAGSLSLAALPSLGQWQPDWIGVRGAVCAGGRMGSVRQELVRQLGEKLGAEDGFNSSMVELGRGDSSIG